MPKVTITIDGQQVQAEAGASVLQAATAAGIEIPTLCSHPALKPVGNCRICLVEIERQRNLQASCVFPVTDGMVIHTDSPKVKEARKFVLELLLSDHSFYCMYCEMSGDCELQTLSYSYGVDRIPYSYNYAWDPVDATREHFIFDPKRCIRCRRCVRVCDEVVANNTLGVMDRGFDSKIIADLNVPFGESSCISCGSCLQVCPTGALTDRASAYMGRPSETQHTKSICSACGVGCGIEAISRSNNLFRIQGDWDGQINHGLLCVRGRFDQLKDSSERFLTPFVRNRGQLRAATWAEALDLVASRIKAVPGASVVGAASPKLTTEALAAFQGLINGLGSDWLGVTIGAFPELPDGAQEGVAEDAVTSDFVIVSGADLTIDHQVFASFVKRGLAKGARLAIVDEQENGLEEYAYVAVKPDKIGDVLEIAGRADAPIVFVGQGTSDATLAALGALVGKAKFIRLIPGANACGAYGLGYGDVSGVVGRAAIVMSGDDTTPVSDNLLNALGEADFVVVQAAYPNDLSDLADVILPGMIWAEKQGTLTNTEGRSQEMARVLEPCADILGDEALVAALSAKLS